MPLLTEGRRTVGRQSAPIFPMSRERLSHSPLSNRCCCREAVSFPPLVWWRPPFIWCNCEAARSSAASAISPPPPSCLPPTSSGSVQTGSVRVERQTARASRRAISPFTRPSAFRSPSSHSLPPRPGPLFLFLLRARRSTAAKVPSRRCLSPHEKHVATLRIQLSVTAASLHSSHCHRR